MDFTIKKPKKILLASGCSYTDENFTSSSDDAPDYKTPYKMWPKYISEHLDLECVNVGKNGYGNQNIYDSLVDAICRYGDRIDTITVLWSGWDRFVFGHDLVFVMSHYFLEYLVRNKKDPAGYNWVGDFGMYDVLEKWVNSSWWFRPQLQLKNQIKTTLTYMISLAIICEQKNIKYIYAQGVNPLNIISYLELADSMKRQGNPHVSNNMKEFNMRNSFLGNPIFSELEKRKDKIIGWPFEPMMGGSYVDFDRMNSKGLWENSKENNLYKVSENDWHPNEKAQPIITQEFLNRYNDLYSL